MKNFWEKLRRKNHVDVTILKQWESNQRELEQGYLAPGVLVRVCGGKGSLREVYAQTETSTYLTLMLGELPLMQLQGEEYFCPTCEKILRSGYCLEQDFHVEMDALNKSKREVPLREAVENIAPLLGLLPSGYYTVLDIRLHPTDGNGHFFWDVPDSSLPCKGTCVYYYGDGEWGYLRPHFTVGTQPEGKCCRERVEYYRRHPDCRAVAYYMDGYMTALLDGHHKAFAAALNHEDFNALVILPGNCFYTKREGMDGLEPAFLTGELEFTLRDLGITEKEIGRLRECCAVERAAEPAGAGNLRELRRRPERCGSAERCGEIEECGRTEACGERDAEAGFPWKTDGLAAFYPSVEEQAEIDRAGEITDERLDQILRGQAVCQEEEIGSLMRALSGLRHKRLREMGEFFLGQPHTGETLAAVLRVLMKLPRTEELEQFFITAMVELETDHPDVGKLILDYL